MNNLDLEIVNTLKVLEQYSTQQAKGEDGQGRQYLSLSEGAIKLTADKTQETSKPQLSKYLSTLVSKLRKGVTHCTPEEKKKAQKTIFQALEVLDSPLASMETELTTHIISNTIDISSNNPFYESDLIVFKDDYQGAIPLNGILEKDFILISGKINDLKNMGKTDGIEIKKERDVKSKRVRVRRSKAMIEAFTQLCTRQIGRDLLNEFSNQVRKVYIVYSTSISGSMTPTLKTSATIHFDPEYKVDVQATKNGETWNAPVPPWITLGHEMIHALHFFTEPKERRKRHRLEHDKSDNMEEFLTITGFPLDETDWMLLFPEGYEKVKKALSLWDPKSENGLRSVYSLPPRTKSHHNITKYPNAKIILENFLDKMNMGMVKDLEGSFSPHFREQVLQLYDWVEVLSKCLEKAYATKQWKIVEQLVKMEAKFEPGSFVINSLDDDLIFAMCEKDENLTKLLTALGATPPNPADLQKAGQKAMLAYTKKSKNIDYSRLTPAFKEIMGDQWSKLLENLAGKANIPMTELKVRIEEQELSMLRNMIEKCIAESRWDQAYALIKREVPPRTSYYFQLAMKNFKNIDEAVLRLTTLVTECKLDINCDRTPLLMATIFGHTELILPILKLGADPQHKHNQQAFVNLCKKGTDLPLIELLIKNYGFNPEKALPVASPTAKEKLKELIEVREQLILQDQIEKHIAESQWDQACALIKREIKPNSSCYFMSAMKKGRSLDEIVLILTALVKECNLDINCDPSPLLVAAFRHNQLIEPILILGADPNFKNNPNALQILCKESTDIKLIELLVNKYGFNPEKALPGANPIAEKKLRELMESY